MRLEATKRTEARRIAAELAAIARTGMVLPGTISERRTHCGKPTCRCMASPPELHGPYWQWTRKVRAKTVGRWLSAEQRDDYRPWIDNAHRIRQLITELEAIGLDAIENDPRTTRR
jgi:hypothetical protein